MHLICPKCGAKNRVPQEKLGDAPVCGRCSSALMEALPVALSDAALPGFLAGTELPVVVDFWAAWCGPCKSMAPNFAAAAKQLPTTRFVKVDTDAAPLSSTKYAIRSIPTLILFEGGKESARLSGAVSATELTRWIQTHSKGHA